MKAFAAFKQQQCRRMPNEGGIVIPRDLYNQLPRDFKIAWEQLTADQQQQNRKLGKDLSNNTKPRKSEQMQVYQAAMPGYQFISTEDLNDMYSCFRASSVADDETAFDISSLSDGEDIDIDNDLTSLTANKTMRKAIGTQATRTRKGNKTLPKKSDLPDGAATKMLAN